MSPKINTLKLEAMRQLRQRRLAAASKLYDRVLQLAPADEDALAIRAQLSLAQADYSRAAGYLARLIAIKPASPDLYFKQGVALQSLGKVEEAEAAYRKAVAINRDHAVASYNLGTTLQAQNKNSEAVVAFERAVSSKPEFALAYYNMGISLRAIGKCAAAIEAHRRAIELDPTYADAHAELASLLQNAARLEDSVTAYRSAIKLKPSDAGYYSGLGVTMYHMGRPDDAIGYYQKALLIDSGLAKAHWNLSLAYLLLGRFTEGWREYEWRKQCGIADRRYPTPGWEGRSLKGKTLLIYGEQGIGDELMFASCYRDLINIADHVVIDCEPRLKVLMRRSFPDSTVHAAREETASERRVDLGPVDYVVAAGSIPRYLRPGIDAYPDTVAYIEADPVLVSKCRNRLRSLGDSIKVGIAWRGGSTALTRALRSIPLKEWAQILKTKGASFVSLQYGDNSVEIAEIRRRFGEVIHVWEDLDQFQDVNNFAAQIAALDLVISIDNTTVHMAGSLGVPTWV
ncbi:MAG: tetratricopeptide repeat protein, partial [Gammaproteobacteria bacterium]